MGQKTNPISLRLNINRNFDSVWFQEKSTEYGKFLQQDFLMRKYIVSLFDFVGYNTGRISVQIFPKKLLIHSFFQKHDQQNKSSFDQTRTSGQTGGPSGLQFKKSSNRNFNQKIKISSLQDPKHLASLKTILNSSQYQEVDSFNFFTKKNFRESRNWDLEAGTSGQLVQAGPTGSSIQECETTLSSDLGLEGRISKVQELKKRFFLKLLLARFYSSQNQNIEQVLNFVKFTSPFLNQQIFHSNPQIKTEGQSKSRLKVGLKILVQNNLSLLDSAQYDRKEIVQDTYLKHIESIFNKKYQSNTVLLPMKIYNKYSSAQFICSLVCQRIQQNVPFRQIYKQLLLEIKKQNSIQGMRIVCSGRLGGVEMARIESRKYGQTSLHVFSNKIDFATNQAYTLYGMIGVKVWVCFREK